MGERPFGLTKDAGWEIGVSRTFALSVEHAWEFLLSPPGLALWLGEGVPVPLAKGDRYETTDGTTGEIRSLRPLDRVRLTWRPPARGADATVQLAMVATAGGCSLRFHTERLADSGEREHMRRHWQEVLRRIGETVTSPT